MNDAMRAAKLSDELAVVSTQRDNFARTIQELIAAAALVVAERDKAMAALYDSGADLTALEGQAALDESNNAVSRLTRERDEAVDHLTRMANAFGADPRCQAFLARIDGGAR